MGFLDKFKKTKKEKPVNKTPPKTLSDVIVQEAARVEAMSPEERSEYEKRREIKQQNREKKRERDHKIYKNHVNGDKFEEEGKFDDAIQCYEENVSLKSEAPFAYDRLAAIYHYKQDFEKERDTLKAYVDIGNDGIKSQKDRFEFIERLSNVEQFLETGKWKFDCLPKDPKVVYYRIKEAKTLLKSDEREKGILMLEGIMADGTYNNTVYNTLYQEYKKDKRYDDCIKVCKKAIDVLGFYSNDRRDRWNINLEKSLKAKEKNG